MNQPILRNDRDDEMSRLTVAVREALTDSMVERLSTTATNALEVVDRLNDEATRDAILHAVERLTEMHRIGALDTLFDIVATLHAVKSAATDNIVERGFAFVEHMLNTVGSEEMAKCVSDATSALDTAVQETAQSQYKGGVLETISMLSKPETQRALHFFMRFGENLQKRAREG